MIQEPDPFLARAKLALAEPVAEDPYLARAKAALADQGGGVGDYVAAASRGLLRSLTGTLEGVAGMGDAFGRARGLRGPEIVPEVRKLREYEPEVHPEVEQSLGGQLVEGATQVAGLIGQSLLVPGSGLAQTGFAAGSMGVQEFGRSQERALAAGESPEDADLAGLYSAPAGVLGAIGPARAVGVFSRAWSIAAKNLGAAALKEGGINALAGAGQNVWSEAVYQSITDKKDAKAVLDAATRGLLPDFLIGGALGAGMRWSASQARALSPDAAKDLETVAAQVAASKTGEASDEFIGDPDAVEALQDGQDAQDGTSEDVSTLPPSTRIEVPDEGLVAAAKRLRKGARLEKDVELHESPLAEHGAKFGARVVDFDPGDGSPVDGYYDRETKTIFLNRRSTGDNRSADLLRHELSHFADDEAPELAKEWQSALDELSPGWSEGRAKERAKRQKEARADGRRLPILTKDGARAEARAEAAEGLGTIMHALETNPALIEQVAGYKPGLITKLRDLIVAFTNKLGITKNKPLTTELVDQLGAVLREKGGDLEKSLEPEAAAQLGLRLRDIYSKLKAETSVEPPRANVRPAPKDPTLREALKAKHITSDEVATKVEEIDTTIEDALVSGVDAEAPRFARLKADRKAALDRLYEVDPTHRLLDKVDPFVTWDRIKTEESNAAKKRTQEDAKNRAIVQRTTAEIDAETARIVAERAKRETQYERDFQKMLKEQEDAEFKKLLDEEKAEKAAAKKKAADEAKVAKKAESDAKKEAARVEREAKKKPLPVKKEKTTEKSAEMIAFEARIAAKKAADPASEPVVEAKPEPKAKLPVQAKRESVSDERLNDPIIRKALEGYAATTGWAQAGGELRRTQSGPTVESEKVSRTKWVPRNAWFGEIPSDLRMSEDAIKKAVSAALNGAGLLPKQRALIEWMLDRADGEAYQGAVTPEDRAKAREYWADQYGILRNDPAQDALTEPLIDESPVRDDEELGATGTDDSTPFALRKDDGQGAFDFGKPTPEQKEATTRDLAAQAKGGDMRALGEILERNRAWLTTVVKNQAGTGVLKRTSIEDLVQETYMQAARDFGKFNYRSEVEMRAWLRTAAVHVVQDVAERFSTAKRSAPEVPMDTKLGAVEGKAETVGGTLPSRARTPAEASVVAEAQKNIREAIQGLKSEQQRRALTMRYWSGADFKEIGEALGVKEDAARMLVNRAEKEIKAFFDEDPLFALAGKGRDGSGVREFLARYAGTEPHYAVTTKAPLTTAARAASEETFVKEKRTRTEVLARARAVLASKTGKAEVDAFINGTLLVSTQDAPHFHTAAELRVNALLRAAIMGNADPKKAKALAQAYFGIRSDAGFTLSTVQRPREPKEMFLAEISEPMPQHLAEMKELQSKLRQTGDAEQRSKIKARIDEITTLEAKALGRGMLALRKAGIDIDAVNDPVSATIAYRTFMQAAVDNSTKATNMLIEWRASAMVSHPALLTSSLLGNIANVGWNTVLMRFAEMPFKGGASMGEMKALSAALPGAMNKAMSAFWNVVRHDSATYEWTLKQKGLLPDAQTFENAKLQSIPGKLGRIVRAPGLTAMSAIDEFARALGSELEAVGIAYRRARGNKSEMVRLLAGEDVWTEAVHRTRRSIFQEDDNLLVEIGFKTRKILDKATGETIPLGTLMFPFIRTGANGLLESLRKMPGPATIIALSNRKQGKWKTDSELSAHDKAAQLLSIGVGMTIWALANAQDEEGLPLVTGSPQGTRAEKAQAWRQAPPMSLNGGEGQWYSYSRAMPFSGVLATGLDVARASGGIMDVGGTILRSVGQQGIDSTYLRTLGTMIDTIQSDAPGDLKTAQAAREFVASFVPNVARAAASAQEGTLKQDPLRREGDGSIEGSDVVSTLGYRLAGSGAERYDWLGRQVEKGGSALSRLISPLTPNRRTEMHEADAVLRAWWEQHPEDSYLPVDAPHGYKVRGETRYMSGRQYADFQKRAGELTRGRLDSANFDPKNPTQAQVDRIEKTIAQARKQARREVLNEIPDEEEER